MVYLLEQVITKGVTNIDIERFGKLVVIGFNNNKGRKTAICQCDCGKIKEIRYSSLVYGVTKSCGCSPKKPFGKHQKTLERIANGEIAEKQNRGRFSPARIIKSLPENILNDVSLKELRYIYGQYITSAMKRDIGFNLSFQEFREKLESNCYYCGSPPANKKKKKDGSFFYYSGIDRINNNIGYVDGNVVSCCITCNKAKGGLEKSAFVDWIKRVYKNIDKISNFMLDM